MAPFGTPTPGSRSPEHCFMSPTIQTMKVDTTAEFSPRQAGQSLGVGRTSLDGSVLFSASPKKANRRDSKQIMSCPPVMVSRSRLDTDAAEAAIKLFTPPVFERHLSSFIRVADLEIDETYQSASSEDRYPNFHHAASDPPPGVDHDPKELWIALNNGDGAHAPIAPVAVERLSNFGWRTSLDKSMWTPDSKTDKALKKTSTPDWVKNTFATKGKIRLPASTADENAVFVWMGSFKHGHYGSELPAIRACGVINMSAKALMELMVDSSRVKEYNKLCLGRDDLVSFQGSIDLPGPFGKSITKVMRSESKPPMIRKTLVFVSLLHAKELEDGSGYLIVTRAVHTPEAKGPANVMKSEILMGVNLIRKIEGAEDSRCLMTNVNHLRSPIVPMMVAKRIGLLAAVSFLNDIRAYCK
jgi:hypothetical protein